MLIISHRGNIDGEIKTEENKPTYIDVAIKKGFDVEIDVWYVDSNFYLGHDQPDYYIDLRFLQDRIDKLWCHAKNLDALEILLQNNLHCFWHQDDDCTLTSRNVIWCYPNIYVKNGITVLKNVDSFLYCYDNYCGKIMGVCTDFANKVQKGCKNFIM